MAIIQEEDEKYILQELKDLTGKVKLVYFTQELECQFCRETKQLLTELVALSDKLGLEVYNFVNDKEKVKEFNIDKIPATVVMGEKDYGIRFYGIPSGYEFVSLLSDIKMVSSGKTQLSAAALEKVKQINKPVHIQVFVTPTCPYCPGAVFMGHQLAMANDFITADMVEATEFPHLAYKYGVRGVPRVVINENVHFEGALPEHLYIEKVLEAL